MSGRPWLMLALGVSGQAAATVLAIAPSLLIPFLHTSRSLSLAEAGLLAAVPNAGMVAALIAWGWAADHIGERVVISLGLALAAASAAAGALFNESTIALGVCLFFGGVGAASTNAASGRVVVGWFPRSRRGLAMGIRQMAQPLGVTVASVTVPTIAAGQGLADALWFAALLTGVMALVSVLALVDPPRPPHPVGNADQRNPYGESSFLWRIHAVSGLLVVPQFTLSTFGLVWLVSESAWPVLAAGLVVGLAQFVGALGRIVAGVWSDRLGSRTRPLRRIAVGVFIAMVLLAALDPLHSPVSVALFVLATALSVADNGIAYTSVAEHAGPFWSGRALGAQNTGQFIVATAVGPGVGWLLALFGYPAAFLASAASALIALPVVPSAGAEADHLTR